jgi:hypothetical protein
MIRVIGRVYAKTGLRLGESSNFRWRCTEELGEKLGSSLLVATGA